jgi:hypothetical protein
MCLSLSRRFCRSRAITMRKPDTPRFVFMKHDHRSGHCNRRQPGYAMNAQTIRVDAAQSQCFRLTRILTTMPSSDRTD